jgi:pyridoxal phosphate enzyme (YggS family)
MNDLAIEQRILQNWQRVQSEVRDAAIRCGRSAEAIQIVGVSKYVDTETTRMLIRAGCRCLGESRPQTLWQKAEAIGEAGVAWHLIGHLQRNKVRRLLKCDPFIESVDSERLIHTIAEKSIELACQTRVLLEVNISGDQAKTGLAPDQLGGLLTSLPEQGIRVEGLMAMAGWGTDPDEARRQFAEARKLRDRLEGETGIQLPQLSMGMSGDFPQAIAEGATIVRIGSRIFEGVI